MKENLRGYVGNFLFALNVFIVFLLLFENKLIVPTWLQPLGRLHPLVLHFPIVLLLLSMVMEFFRFKTVYNTQEFYQSFTSSLLLTGVITSGISVVMGLFLSREEGYESSMLTWHKWTGVGVFFIASIIYSCRNLTWYSAPVARAGAILTTLCLVFAGHFGASLTHGDNFILQPVMAVSQSVVPVEEARVFDHVIKPVFDRKCAGCHNPDKVKGGLVLTDSASVVKGGKTGRLFVAGKPEQSLLLKRIHLPLENKKHMPPTGKAQLTAEEIELLYHWVRGDAAFSKRVTAMPLDDSLRLLATALLKNSGDSRETFDFSYADEQAVKKLNTNYRVVTPLAKNSPALTVNIYNRDTYTPRTLDELKEVKLQVISLDVGKMPVQDEDLKHISRFENLRKLNLNFTEVTGHGLSVLAGLKELRTLSLSGTKINSGDLRQFIPLCKKLEKLTVWDAGLSASEIEELQKSFPHISIFGGMMNDHGPLLRLNPPRLKNASAVFDDSISLQLFHPVKGVEIRFTTDGSEPDSISSELFRENTILKESTQIKARAYKGGWLGSEVATLNVYSSVHKPDTAILLSRLNRVHTANGAKTFFDHQLGSFNANSPAWANNWAGVINNDLELMLEFKSPAMMKSVAFNILVETETFIFPPDAVEIWGGTSQENMTLITRMKPEQPKAYRKPFIHLLDCRFNPRSVSYLKIIAKPVKKLPGWHKRKDKPALLLVDEIFIN